MRSIAKLACFLVLLLPFVSRCESIEDAKAAAEWGGGAAQFRYAEMLRDGRGVKKNVLEVAVWTRKDESHERAKTSCGVSK